MSARALIIFALAFGLCGAGAVAGEITRSPLPIPRPGTRIADPIASTRGFSATAKTPAPLPPEILAAPAPSNAPTAKPRSRPRGLAKIFGARAKNQPPTAAIQGKAGSVCGVNAIHGSSVPAIPGRLKGCGVQNPVRVTSVGGVRLSTPATMDCTTAKALHSWIEKGAKPAVGRKGGGIAQIKVAAGYACRTRNNQPGAKISEHGRGRAIDISALKLADGSDMTVLKGWNDRRQGPMLKKMHRAACGPFGTVLGPNANKYHRDHFHFDTARYRSGSYCR